MKINRKFRKQVEYELMQKNKTNIQFSKIESKLNLNKNTFILQNKEILTFKCFSIAFLVIIIFLIIIGFGVLMEKKYELEQLLERNTTINYELNEQKDKALKTQIMCKELEKEIVFVTNNGSGVQTSVDYLDPNYQFYDGLTLREKQENIYNDFIVSFQNIEKIYLNEDEYVNIYLNKKWSKDSNKKVLAFKPFLESNHQKYEISFLINSNDYVFILDNCEYINVCDFQLTDNIVINVKISIRLNNEEIITKSIQIISDNK